ncbi:hypothetical protein C241_08274 [Bradyrhizobium lupini HPC(L)]|uniref:Uncharacterized protein n=1 Tax=Bradyrhizobium lupini HPC(L) TaxID=1229491 RepID=A0ABN0HP16_RHILU|nr:hypothetical protein C241_08274 [Bradyrhizobium lupini HPC(L)]
MEERSRGGVFFAMVACFFGRSMVFLAGMYHRVCVSTVAIITVVWQLARGKAPLTSGGTWKRGKETKRME